MKIMATFDGTAFSEATLPVLTQIAALGAAEFMLISVSHEPHGRQRSWRRARALPSASGTNLTQSEWIVDPAVTPQFAETKDQAHERRIAELEDYLSGLAAKLPRDVTVHREAHVSDDVAATIVERARAEKPDVIVMATHSKRGLGALFGSTTDQVVRSGVAPVLLVHPKA
jgi:nucleotide-binding universal stress UspA family protein